MALFDTLIRELGHKFNLGGKAGPLVMELLRDATSQRGGGLSGFVNRFKGAGLDDLVTSWVGRGENRPLTPAQVETALGSDFIGRIAAKVGMSSAATIPALAYAVPKLIDKLTPSGSVPATLPAEVATLLASGAAPAPGAPTVIAATSARQRPAAAVTAASSGAVASARSQGGGFLGKLLPLLGLALLVVLVFWLFNRSARQTAAPTTAPTMSAHPDAQPGSTGQLVPTETTAPPTPQAPAPAPETGAQPSMGSPDGTTNDVEAQATKVATETSLAALNALPSGYSASSLVDALNASIIVFATGSAQISTDSLDYLREAAKAFKGAPAGTVIEVGGHTDASGDAATNDRLSQARAEAVREALIGYGVKPAMLTAQGYGGSRPVAGSDTPEGRFANRRIEFSVVK